MGKDSRNNLRGLAGGAPLFGAGGGRINTQPAEVHDAFGRPLGVGDLIQVHTGTSPMLRVQSIERVVESGVPDGLMEIVVYTQLKFRAPRAQPNQEFVRIMTAKETGMEPAAPQAPPAGGLEHVEDLDGTRIADGHVDGYSGEPDSPELILGVDRAAAGTSDMSVQQARSADEPRVTLD